VCESKMSSGFESKIFAIALKASESDQKLQSVAGGLARVVWFRVPGADLRVGTLDLLMSLSDDLSKMDTVAEGAVWKIYRQLLELQPGVPTIQGVDVATYAFKQFDWDEAKFQVKTPLRELCESIASRIGGLDEELKAKMSEYNAVKGALTASERKAQGNLMVRGLTDIVREEDLRGTDESDWMSTMLVVVPKNGLREFVTCYESVCPMVVPRSAKKLAEDAEFVLFAVVVFKKTQAEFIAAAREKRWTIRDFSFEPDKLAMEHAKKAQDTAEEHRLKRLLTNWCQINFAEAFMMLMHLKAVRVFVESVLRFGLASSQPQLHCGGGPNFTAFLLQPRKGKEEALHKALCAAYGGGVAANFEAEEEAAVPGATGEFYPYVFVPVETEAPGMV